MVTTFNMCGDNDQAEHESNENQQLSAYINRHNILYIDETYYLAMHELQQPIPQKIYPAFLTYIDINAFIDNN